MYREIGIMQIFVYLSKFLQTLMHSNVQWALCKSIIVAKYICWNVVIFQSYAK